MRSKRGQRGRVKLALAVMVFLAVVFSRGVGGSQPPPGDPSPTGVTATGGLDLNAASAEDAASGDSDAATSGKRISVIAPFLTLILGIAIVLGLIIGMKVNAFIAMIAAAMVVSLLAPGDVSEKIGRVASAFGSTAGGIGIVIALAAVIGKCMLDSGAADRIVRSFVRLLGEDRAPWALMISGYVLAIPVFFDTVFYLLVPLARSLHRRTGKHYLMYLMAIAAGGAITHSLVPPTPGPLLMASTLNIDLGVMIMVGLMVALPSAIAGVFFAGMVDRLMPVPMRALGSEPEPAPLADEQLPSLWLSLAPVVLPVVLISINTILTTYADSEPVARLQTKDVSDWPALQQQLASAQPPSPEARIVDLLEPSVRTSLTTADLSQQQQEALLAGLNAVIAERAPGMQRSGLYQEDAFQAVRLSPQTKKLIAKSRERMAQAEKEHINRLVLEEALNRTGDRIRPHQWNTSRRRWAQWSELIGNANLALLLSTVIALLTLVKTRGLTRREAAAVVETSLMSGGVIILITSGGGAFGKMLQEAQIGPAIEALFSINSAGSRTTFLLLGFGIALVLKIAQGSGTVAMIVGSSMMAAIVSAEQLGCHPVYLAMAIGGGSMVGSWMNDSGFWIFAKMGVLTEQEALKSWTLLLTVCGLVSLLVSLLLAHLLPLT